MTQSQFGIGQPVQRFEDPRLLRGEGRFVNDLNLPGQAHLVYVRSPHAHAMILSVDTAEARAAPGVVGVYTIEDLERDGIVIRKRQYELVRKLEDGNYVVRVPDPPK